MAEIAVPNCGCRGLSVVYIHEGFPLAIKIPFGGDLHLGYWYIVFIAFWLVGFSNAVNLSDGLDGLVAGLGTISLHHTVSLHWFNTRSKLACFASPLLVACWHSLFSTISPQRSLWVTWVH